MRVVGRMGCTTQTTPQATPCITDGRPPRISVTALLQLTQWCQARRDHEHGGSVCPTTRSNGSPPAPSAEDACRRNEPDLVGAPPTQRRELLMVLSQVIAKHLAHSDAEGGQP